LDELRTDLKNLLPGEEINVYPVHRWGVPWTCKLTTAAAADMALQLAERHVGRAVWRMALSVGQSKQVLLKCVCRGHRSAVKRLYSATRSVRE